MQGAAHTPTAGGKYAEGIGRAEYCHRERRGQRLR